MSCTGAAGSSTDLLPEGKAVLAFLESLKDAHAEDFPLNELENARERIISSNPGGSDVEELINRKLRLRREIETAANIMFETFDDMDRMGSESKPSAAGSAV